MMKEWADTSWEYALPPHRAEPPLERRGSSLLAVDPLREQKFQRLVKNVQACHYCPRMEGRTRVLGPANGSLDADILFIAEAPGRLGADSSGIPLMGDQT